jgi:hypothetical protein
MTKNYPENVYLDLLSAWGETPLDKEEVLNIISTYGNTRVEEIIKIIETLNIEGVNRFDGDKTQNVRDYLNDWLMPEIKQNLIEAIKK